jgi:hypothetical protein
LRAGWLETSESAVNDILDSGSYGLAIETDGDGLRRGGSNGNESSEEDEGTSSGVVKMLYSGLMYGEGGEVIKSQIALLVSIRILMVPQVPVR